MNQITIFIAMCVLFLSTSLNADIVHKANKKFNMGNFKKAAKYMPQACATNDAKSCYLAGYLYVNGIGVIQDTKRAIGFYKQSCDLGYKKACKYVKKYSKKDNGIIKKFNTKYNTEFQR
jgi:TPR repeat protein